MHFEPYAICSFARNRSYQCVDRDASSKFRTFIFEPTKMNRIMYREGKALGIIEGELYTEFNDVNGDYIFDRDHVKLINTNEIGEVVMDKIGGAWCVRTEDDEFFLSEAILEGVEVVYDDTNRVE